MYTQVKSRELNKTIECWVRNNCSKIKSEQKGKHSHIKHARLQPGERNTNQ